MGSFSEGTPTVEIVLNGKPYELGFTIGAMRRGQELGVLDIDTSSGAAFMRAMPEFIWMCMTEEGRKEYSVATIAELLNPINIAPILKQVGDLFLASMPKPDPKGNPGAVKAPTPGPSTSNSSGPLVGTTSG